MLIQYLYTICLLIYINFSGNLSLQILLTTCFLVKVKKDRHHTVNMKFNVFYSTCTNVFFILVTFFTFFNVFFILISAFFTSMQICASPVSCHAKSVITSRFRHLYQNVSKIHYTRFPVTSPLTGKLPNCYTHIFI